MQISLNGAPHELAGALTIAELLDSLELSPRKVAVECNLAIVPQSRYDGVRLVEGDRIEIVHFIGGGA